ncbi:ATP-dependent RecD-like DNA helicase [Flavobacteriaceae bacterium XHP0103]|uniref:ATP-dependent DNA helicase n=1 Tax=Marixanthotalea marina TaxID=2844359 RepID=UPI002989F37E|nr:ATP-dependent RecD-like DNA helicase [Marixanthotalea marina]MBU3820734.1 ATP-dependent RecD-like DNA helicase [Marixanthotalea marina]
MNEVTSHIINIDKAICKNIEKFDAEERGLLSQNILSQLRNFVEHIGLKILEDVQNTELSNDYANIQDAIEYIKARGDLKFLSRFHKLLQITASHYTLNEESSERLLLKYYEYLIKIKSFLKDSFNLEVLHNLEEFPIQTDSNLKEYYEKISHLINLPKESRVKSDYKDRYYIQKIKPFFINGGIYYEVTFKRANDYTSKFDRIIAFTNIDILGNYAVKLSISMDYIEILDKRMPIKIIDEWEVSIRPCEIDNFAKIFGISSKISSGKESYELMKYLTSSGLNLIEVINLNDWYYNYVKKTVTEKARVSRIFKLLDKCREMSKNKSDGSNVIRYLLLRLNNKIIKKQYNHASCELLSNLKLEYGCIPFDQMPFNSALINHNPKLSDLFASINTDDRKHEILARHIKNNTEQKGQLYTKISEIENFENIEELIDEWNDNLYWKHKNRRIEIYKKHAFIKGYEADTYSIIEKLKEVSSDGIKNYKNSIESWLQSTSYGIDCDEKKLALKNLFEHSKVALIYGAAGTGKSTMINHISNFFDKESKLYLANTNPAVDNLKRNIKVANCTFKTITKFSWSHDNEYDILIIDECSTVSNSDMLKILNKAKFRLLILVGDVFQIESILFGNWFTLIKYFIPESSVFELEKPYRSNNQNLLRLWQRVRNIEDSILETLTKNQYSTTLDNSIFQSTEDDEIILCLNYDGLYGINNINSFLQSSNNNQAFVWGTHTYKVNDPIIFNESGRFSPLIYNNLKGRIFGIELLEDKIQFDIEVFLVLNEFDTEWYDFELLDNAESGYSVIRFKVDKYKSTDEDDDDSSNIIPFQVAYAVSIHKAQGLEYNSVKIVITDEVEEMISHNIFYTAITRAKEKLKIYWTPESEKKILGSFKTKFNRKDYSLLKKKYSL